MSETANQTKVLRWFRDLQKDGHPIFFQKRQAGGYGYKEGIPDIYVVYNGIHIEIEMKATSHSNVRAMQEKFEERCKKQFNILYIRSYDFETIKKFIIENCLQKV